MVNQRKVLVVCHGNVNRSALCAAVLARDNLLEVRSAGVKPELRPGPAAKKMRDAALERGIDLSAHRSEPITQELVDWADDIVYMDSGNLRRMLADHESAFEKMRCLGAYATEFRTRIPDPAFMRRDSEEFEATVDLIIEASENYVRSKKSGA